MSTAAANDTIQQELAQRVSGSLEVTLFWDTRDNSTSICLQHAATDETISFRVPPGHALDAFHHPFAHVGNQLDHDLQPAQRQREGFEQIGGASAPT